MHSSPGGRVSGRGPEQAGDTMCILDIERGDVCTSLLPTPSLPPRPYLNIFHCE